MKKDLSSLELHYLLKEIQSVVSGKVEQIYQIGKEELILHFHIPGSGKKFLRIVLGKLLYLASNKGEMPEKPQGFCLFLRKKLKNSRLRQISQLDFERIVELVFETKECKFRLFVELFSKGNAVLCSEDGVILSALEKQEWKDRSIRQKEIYKYPKKEYNVLAIGQEELTALLNNSAKENLVKTLAIELGLGGVYAEEVCFSAGVDKNIKSSQLSAKEADLILSAIRGLLSKNPAPVIVYDEHKKEVLDIVPFRIRFYEKNPFSESKCFNDALDSVLTEKTGSKLIEKTEKAALTKIDKINEIIFQQKSRIDGLSKSEKENQREGEIIYENYALINHVLEEIREQRKKDSWEEIKRNFKNHKIIKDINEKTGEITVEI